MDQRNETFVPHVLAITVGTTVDFPNSDNIYHNVFSLRGPRPFDLGRYAAGRSKAVRFDRPGIVRVFCEIHSHMSAFILVFNHRYFAVTSADGRYQIGRVPPGRYTLVAWNEGAIRESRAVMIPEDGGAVEADFAFDSRVTILGSLTNRIFLASAALAVVSIGAAVYFVSLTTTRQAEAELQRGPDRSRYARRRAVRDAGADADRHGAPRCRRSPAESGSRYRRPANGAAAGTRLSGAAQRGAAGADRQKRECPRRGRRSR